MRPQASCCLVPSGRSQGRPEKREPRLWTDPRSLGLCCREARSRTKPSGLLFASQRAGLKAIPIIPQDLSSFSRAKQDPAHHYLLHLVLPYLSANPLLCLRCVSPLWNGCIFNQFFVHSYSHHPRPVSGFLFHRRRSCNTSCENKTSAYAHLIMPTTPSPTPPSPSSPSSSPSPPPPATSSAAAVASPMGTTSTTPPPPPGLPFCCQPMTMAPSPSSPSSSMSQASTTSNQI